MLRIGLIGASKIAVNAIIKPAAKRTDIDVISVAASRPERAAAYAKEHDIPHVDASYQELCDNPDVDLVYIGLPPSHHYEWSVKAVSAGKPVLCEKPFALNAAEALKMVRFAADRGVPLVEAFHHRYHPLFKHILEIIRTGALGQLMRMDAGFAIEVPNVAGEFRYEAAFGGGALMDLGCYPVHWIRSVAGSEPVDVRRCSAVKAGEIDISLEADLGFAGGIEAHISCSMAAQATRKIEAHLVVEGREGLLRVDNPLQPEIGSRLTLETKTQTLTQDYSGATFDHQLDYVKRQLAGGVPALTGGGDAVANMRVIDRLYEQAGLAPRG